MSTGKMSFLRNSMNLIFEKCLNIHRESFRKCVEAFLTKLFSSGMNHESIGSRNQVDVGPNCKNEIPQSFLQPIESHE